MSKHKHPRPFFPLPTTGCRPYTFPVYRGWTDSSFPLVADKFVVAIDDYKDLSVTRQNVEALLRGGRLQVAMRNGKWWDIRPNGKLKRYKRDPMRLRLPFRYGLYGQGQITEDQFMPDGMLDNTLFRVKP